MLRICRKLNIKSTIKYSNNGCTRQAASPQYIAENILNREFTAKAPNEKWLTDVTEFHYYIGMEKRKVYLSAILDLYDRRIVSYVIRDKNNNASMEENYNIEYALERILEKKENEMESIQPEKKAGYDLQEELILDDWIAEQEMKGQAERLGISESAPSET